MKKIFVFAVCAVFLLTLSPLILEAGEGKKSEAAERVSNREKKGRRISNREKKGQRIAGRNKGKRGEGEKKVCECDGEKRQAPSAAQIIERMRKRKAKMIQRMTEKYEALPGRLEKMQERLANLGERQKRECDEGQGKGNREKKRFRVGRSAKGLPEGATIEERITHRYQNFKKMISERREKFSEASQKYREMLTQRIAKLSEVDQKTVLEEFETSQKEVRAKIDELSEKSLALVEEAYKSVLTKLKDK